MRDDGWWWEGADAATIKRKIALEFASAMLIPTFLRAKHSASSKES